MLKVIVKLIALLLVSTAHAEYRVFELVIQNTADKSERIVTSSLDPLQYPGYYDLRQGEIAMYRTTWMCWGDTSQLTKYCPNPKLNQSPENSPETRSLASP
jgi:hypothetical protein